MEWTNDPVMDEYRHTAMLEEQRAEREAGCPVCSGCGELITYGRVYKVGRILVCEECYEYSDHMSVEDYKGGIYEF